MFLNSHFSLRRRVAAGEISDKHLEILALAGLREAIQLCPGNLYGESEIASNLESWLRQVGDIAPFAVTVVGLRICTEFYNNRPVLKPEIADILNAMSCYVKRPDKILDKQLSKLCGMVMHNRERFDFVELLLISFSRYFAHRPFDHISTGIAGTGEYSLMFFDKAIHLGVDSKQLVNAIQNDLIQWTMCSWDGSEKFGQF